MSTRYKRGSDDDFQRHNANRHHREQSGQDRFGQQALLKRELYSIEGEKEAGGEVYYWLRSTGQNGQKGPRDKQWVNAKEVIHKGRLVLA